MAEKKLTFEQAMSRLEELVSQLERGETPLEESLAMFEEGTRLMKQCTTLLDKAERKITVLTKEKEGEYAEQPFAEKL